MSTATYSPFSLSAHAALPAGLALAVHATDMQGKAPEWIHMVPAGEFSGRDGRGPYRNDQPATVIEAFGQLGMDLPLDYEHQSLSADAKRGGVPASGWGKALEARDGHIWGKVEWTANAKAMIEAREYRYFSPVFLFEKKSGRIVQLVGGGLTNNPNLYLQAVAHSYGQDAHAGGSMNIEKLMERLIYLLNLPATTTASDMVGHLDKVREALGGAAQSMGLQSDARLPALLESATQVGEATTAAAQALGLAPNTALTDVLAAAQKVAAAKTKAAQAAGLDAGAELEAIVAAAQAKGGGADLTQYVPRAEFDNLAQQFQAREQAAKTERAEALVTAAMTKGLDGKGARIAPASEQWAKDYAARDPDGFEAFIKTAPVIASPHSVVPGGAPQTDESAEDELAAQIAGPYAARNTDE